MENNNFISNTVKINSIELTNYKGTILDILNIVVEINIYESIYENAILGSIEIIDSNDLIQFFPIIGEETLNLDMILPGSDTDSLNFILDNLRIYKITDREIKSDKVQRYTLWFTSKEAITNREVKISKAWKEETTDKMVKDVFTSLKTEKTLVQDPTIGIHNYFSTNIEPFEVLNYLARTRSIDSNKLSDFMFFENFDISKKTTKFNFRSLGGLSATKPVMEFWYGPTNNNKDGHNVQPYNIDNIVFHQGFDVLDSKKHGMYNQTFVYYDILRKRYVFQKNTYDDVFNESKDKRLEGSNSSKIFETNTNTFGEHFEVLYVTGFPERISSTQDTSEVHNKTIEVNAKRDKNGWITERGESSDKTSTLVEETIFRRRILLNEYENNKIYLNDISGNFNYSIGNTIIFNKPHIVVNKAEIIDSHNDSYDIFASGVYLITKSRHRITIGETARYKYKTYLEISKNTIKNSISSV